MSDYCCKNHKVAFCIHFAKPDSMQQKKKNYKKQPIKLKKTFTFNFGVEILPSNFLDLQ